MSAQAETIIWTDQKLIYALLAKNKQEGWTAGEMEHAISRTGTHRRLSEMETMGLARKSGKRVCRITNKTRDVWFWDDSSPKPPKVRVQQAHKIKVLEDRIRFLEKENAKIQKELELCRSR